MLNDELIISSQAAKLIYCRFILSLRGASYKLIVKLFMTDLDRVTLARVRRNTDIGTVKGGPPMKGKLPDQTGIIKELVEMKAMQNGVKNKMRKVLFAADKGKHVSSWQKI